MLVLTRPLHAHRLADRLRQEHGVGRRVIGAVRAIRSRPLDEHDTHLLGHEAEDARQGGAHAVGALRRRPDRGGVAANVCDGARRRKRRVTLTRPEVRRRHRRLRRRQRRLERGPGLIAVADWPRWSAVHNRLVALDHALAQIALQVVVPGQPAPRGPFRLELARRPHRCPLVVRDDREEALDPDDANAGKLRDGGFVDRDERCTDGWRPDHAAVEHAGNAEVLDVPDSAPCTWQGPRASAGTVQPSRTATEGRAAPSRPLATRGAGRRSSRRWVCRDRLQRGALRPRRSSGQRPGVSTASPRDRGAPGGRSPQPDERRCLRVSAPCCRPCRRCSDSAPCLRRRR